MLALAGASAALVLDVQTPSSIQDAAGQIAKTLYFYHDASSTAGEFDQPEPWYWWESGEGWNALMHYTIYTNDTTYEADILSSLAANVGPNYDFVPPSQSGWEANDDQVYWVYNALTALEHNFTALPCAAGDGEDGCANSWLAISTNAFEDFVRRWAADGATCNGGLKWQYDASLSGWTYKNSVSNGGFFQTAARLARYTGNQTFADWADRVWAWSEGVGFLDGANYHVYDGAGDEDDANCTQIDRDEWSYNLATYLHGAAHMHAYTGGGPVWDARVRGLVAAASDVFFTTPAAGTGTVMYEPACEPQGTCSSDQTSFKASLARWMGSTARLVPDVAANITTLLRQSAKGAAASCAGYGNSTCGLQWTTGGFDGRSDFGVQLSALEAVLSLLAADAGALAVAPA
ncbi:glycoside hydrolase family 76 protein [Xylariaceae sp. FL0804]|nr:glycoside hydrolase family 76 protein [Xylariaceae sp. FL0804]